MSRSLKVIIGGVLLLLVSAVVFLAVFLHGLGSERADRWASVGSLLVAVVGLALTGFGVWLTWHLGRTGGGGGTAGGGSRWLERASVRAGRDVIVGETVWVDRSADEDARS